MQTQQPEALIRMMTQPSHPLKMIASIINMLIIGLTIGLIVWLFQQPNEHQPCTPRQEFVPLYDDKKIDRLTQMIGNLQIAQPPPPREDFSDNFAKINKRLAKLEKWIMSNED